MSPDLTSYDELPYESTSIPAADPVALSFSSWMHGGPRPRVRGFRALELGCGNGANLLPLAFYHPDSHFIGVDDSRPAIVEARTDADALGLERLRFEEMDLADFEPAEGSYDYVLVPGVFSWVDDARRRRILEICRSALAPGGLAFLSYNAHPGWKIRGVVRDLLQSGVAHATGATERVERAREVAASLRSTLGEPDDPYQQLLARELERLDGRRDSYLFHEYLAEHNAAFFHGEFVAQLAVHGLRHVCDAMHDRPEGRVPVALREELERQGYGGDSLEETIDVLCNRQLRSAVLCREEAEPASDVRLTVGDWNEAGLTVTTSTIPCAGEEHDEAGGSWFEEAEGGGRFHVADPDLRASLEALGEHWPEPVAIEALDEPTQRCLLEACDPHTDDPERPLGALIELHRIGLVRLRPASPHWESRRAGVPHALARLEARRGRDLTTPLHSLQSFSGFDREVLLAFDTHRDLESVTQAIAERIEPDDGAELGMGPIREAVEACLERAAEWGLTLESGVPGAGAGTPPPEPRA